MSEISTGRLALGANMGFSRLDCRVCHENTLHKHGACIHCETDYEPPRDDRQRQGGREMAMRSQLEVARIRGRRNMR